MAIEFVAAAATAGASNEHPIPAVQAGDLIVLLAIRTSSIVVVHTPAGYSELYAPAQSTVVAYKFAEADAAETTVKSTYSQRAVCVVYRGVNTDTPFGDSALLSRAARENLIFPALDASAPETSTIVALISSAVTDNRISTDSLTGFTNRLLEQSGASFEMQATSFAGETVALSATTTTAAVMFGLVPADTAPSRRRNPLFLTPW